MEERDYFKRQIDLLGKVLGKLLAELIGKKSNGGIETTNQVLKNQLDIEIYDLIAMSKDEIIDFLKTKKQLNDENLEQIAEILMLNIETNSENRIEEIDKLNLLEKCLKIYNYIQANDKTYSFERNMKIQKIQLLISN
jgi:hypothetical protein